MPIPGIEVLFKSKVVLGSDEAAVEEFADSAILAAFQPDGLVVSAAGAAPHGPIETLPTRDTQALFDSKFWSAYHSCKHIGPKLSAKRATPT